MAGPKLCQRSTSYEAAAIIFAFSLIATIGTQLAQAQTYTETIVYQFQSYSGWLSYAGVIRDEAGNLYGATYGGGPNNAGVVYEIDTTGNYIQIYNFTGGADGAGPNASLLRDSEGNLYGTTVLGGDTQFGTIFKVSPNGTETVLHSFSASEGNEPYANLVTDGKGNLYGTTHFGGFGDEGAVFKLESNGTYTVIHYFQGSPDGALPYSGVIVDQKGNLYGTTSMGGAYNEGTVFKVDPNETETVLYSFKGRPSDGAEPIGGLLSDTKGNLYGTTVYGGSGDHGIVFRLAPNGTETVLHNFASPRGGEFPTGTLVGDASGNLYGTTQQGGSGTGGTVFKLTKTGAEVVLHSFDGRQDGQYPWAGVIRDNAGNLYGTTYEGNDDGGDGVVFKLTP
jgi:uncharacterized repeat protein (TIGR03803 family)